MLFKCYNKRRRINRISRCDGIGRRVGLKIQWWQHRAGSTPATGTRKEPTFVYDKCGFFSTKSVLTDGINPTSVG